MRFPRASRLTRERELEAVRLQGKRLRTSQLEVRYLASPVRHSRVGVIVPRHGRSAVARNTVKRRLRELARTELLPLLALGGAALDVVIRAAPASYAATFEELQAALRKLSAQLPTDAAPTPEHAA